jgi:hypothetical protein
MIRYFLKWPIGYSMIFEPSWGAGEAIHGVNFTRLASSGDGLPTKFFFLNAEDVSIDRQAVEILEKLLVYIASRVLCVVRNFSMD